MKIHRIDDSSSRLKICQKYSVKMFIKTPNDNNNIHLDNFCLALCLTWALVQIEAGKQPFLNQALTAAFWLNFASFRTDIGWSLSFLLCIYIICNVYIYVYLIYNMYYIYISKTNQSKCRLGSAISIHAN